MKIDFNKGLIPAIIQDVNTKNVLMLGYMNKEAYDKTLESELVTFYSRSKKRLWTKGEESGFNLKLRSIKVDCDQDTLLIQAEPLGPVCHKGTTTCWGNVDTDPIGFLNELESTITERIQMNSGADSYTKSLYDKGINKMAQKVGEEAVEMVIEAKDDNDDLFLEESADLLYHYLLLLQAKNKKLKDVVKVLSNRA